MEYFVSEKFITASLIMAVVKRLHPLTRRMGAYGMKIWKSNPRHCDPPKEEIIRRKMTLPSRTRSPSESFAEASRRLSNSTEGRFTIIDEKSKDSESFDDASSTDSDDFGNKFSRSFVTITHSSNLLPLCPSPIPIALTVPRAAVHKPHLPLSQIKMTNSTGRFRVGKVIGDPGATSLQLPPIEKRYKRGRWESKDWYDQHDLNGDHKRHAKVVPLAAWNDITFPVPTVFHPNNNNINTGNMLAPNLHTAADQHSSTAGQMQHMHPPLAHETTVFSMEDDSDRENNLPEFNSVSSRMDIHQPNNNNNNISNNNSELASPSTTNPSSTSFDIEKPNSLSVLPGLYNPGRSKFYGTPPDILSGRVTPLEMQLHYGLERSLSSNGVGYTYPFFDAPMSASNGNGNNNGIRGSSIPPQDRSNGNANSQIIAIDSKIEQAMDLVKTHLMFAVREEVELLRAKIVELDTTIAQLQSENAILREHVPPEILQNLDGGPVPNSNNSSSAATTTNVSAVAAQ